MGARRLVKGRLSMATESVASRAVRREERICFGLAWFADEADANAYAAEVKAAGNTYNGGFFHGMPCGRESHFDYNDPERGRLYAVSN